MSDEPDGRVGALVDALGDALFAGLVQGQGNAGWVAGALLDDEGFLEAGAHGVRIFFRGMSGWTGTKWCPGATTKASEPMRRRLKWSRGSACRRGRLRCGRWGPGVDCALLSFTWPIVMLRWISHGRR